jgi:hypothetical protein
MKVQFADSFTKSLKRLITHETWWYKTYEFIRWDIWHFFGNIWKFRKELYNHHWWDYHFTLQMLYRSISIMEKGMHGGLEVRESRDKKIKKMNRVLYLLNNKIEDKYIELAELELGIKYTVGNMVFTPTDESEESFTLSDGNTDEENTNNQLISDRSREIEQSQWIELWDILKGANHNEFLDIMQQKETEGASTNNVYDDWYDGSDLRGWWD